MELALNTALTKVQERDGKILAPLHRGKDKWLKATPKERVRQEYVLILLNTYGYAVDQMEQELRMNSSKRGQDMARADIVVWRSGEDRREGKSPLLVVECKAQQVRVQEEDYYQGYDYALRAGADVFVMTNQKETKFFRVANKLITKTLEEIIEIPHARDGQDEKKIQELLTKTKTFTRDDFSKLLFKCHNIIRNNDKLSPEAAFDEISKLLFMKIRYERQQARTQAIFSEQEFLNLKAAYVKMQGNEAQTVPFYQHLFTLTKEAFAKDDLFDSNDSLKIREASFLHIVRELQKYNLSDTADDIKGIAFEEFLGRTFRGELGQFFTPRTVVDYMVEVLDPEEGETICDPCCGSGGFLIKAFEYVRDKIERHVQQVKESIKQQVYPDDFVKLPKTEQEKLTERVDAMFEQLNLELDLQHGKGRLRQLSYDCIFGTDANPRMARTAKMNMIMHGDGHGGVHHHDGLLNVNGIFEGRFDVILTNPPFGARVEKSLRVTENDIPSPSKIKHYTERYGEQYEELVVQPLREYAQADNGHGKPKGKPVLDLFAMGEFSGLTEVLFIERCLNLLRPGGRMGVVLPEGVLNNSQLQRIRDFVEGRAKLLNITSIPQDVFMASGATVKPSIVFLKKFSEEEVAQYAAVVAQETEHSDEEYGPHLAKLDVEYQVKAADLKEAKDRAGLRELTKKYKAERAEIEAQQAATIQRAVKVGFSYPVPLVEVELAGISSTGTVIDNELEAVAKEYEAYRRKHQLWTNRYDRPSYYMLEDEARPLGRMMFGEADAPLYGASIVTLTEEA
jgi:type I restriction enzyme M protein